MRRVLARDAMRPNPFYPNYYLGDLANAPVDLGRHDEAVEPLQTAVERDPRLLRGSFAAGQYIRPIGTDRRGAGHASVLAPSPENTP